MQHTYARIYALEMLENAWNARERFTRTHINTNLSQTQVVECVDIYVQ